MSYQSAKYLKNSLKRVIQKFANYFGYKLRKIPTPQPWNVNSTGHSLASYVKRILADKGHINFIQIGANDGRINDPIYHLTSKYRSCSTIVLIEPQEYLIPILQENYQKHPNAIFINGAVGEEGEAKLYSVDKNYWSELEIPYAKDWPIYRAPTGVTSLSKEHVKKWLEQVTDKPPKHVDAMIVEHVIEIQSLNSLLLKNDIHTQCDVLQVDTEGYDDVVLYCSLDDSILPLIINFEHEHLERDRLIACVNWLVDKSYECFVVGTDMLCIKKG